MADQFNAPSPITTGSNTIPSPKPTSTESPVKSPISFK